MKLLSRNEFKEAVFNRDKHQCVICGQAGKDAHHILERRLFKAAAELGGYFLDNGATLCSEHHLAAEDTSLSCQAIRQACGIQAVVLPSQLSPDVQYDKWGNILKENGKRWRSELFYEEPVQKILRPYLETVEKYMVYPIILPISQEEETQLFENQEVVLLQLTDGVPAVWHNDAVIYRPLQSDVPPPAKWLDIKDLIDDNLYFVGNQSTTFEILLAGVENEYLSWAETKQYADILNLNTLPILYEGIYQPNLFPLGHYVIRLARAFTWYETSKFVRAYHP